VADLRYPPEDAAEAKTNREEIEDLMAELDAEQVVRAKERAAEIDVLTGRPNPNRRNLCSPAKNPLESSLRAVFLSLALAVLLESFPAEGGKRILPKPESSESVGMYSNYADDGSVASRKYLGNAGADVLSRRN
jgi:hypothetical protein